MKIPIYLDIPEDEDDVVEARAKEWRKESIEDLCKDYGFARYSVHGEGCEVMTESWIDTGCPSETRWTCLAGLAEQMEGLETSWTDGSAYEALMEHFGQEDIATAGLEED